MVRVVLSVADARIWLSGVLFLLQSLPSRDGLAAANKERCSGVRGQ